ncbi:hypothetical protein N2W54_003539 [Lotmaria passim]
MSLATSSDAVAATTAAGCRSGAENDAAASAESPSSEVARLRDELQQCQTKFNSWKDKAKSGVDNMRAQIIDLTQRLERSEQEKSMEICGADEMQASALAQSDIAATHSFAAACLFIDTIQALYIPSSDVAATSTPPGAAAAVSPSPSPQDAVIRKLQRTIQDQSDRLKETRYALKRSINEGQQRVEALQRQDEVVASLKRRIEALEAANVSLEEQLMNAPNTEEWRAAQEELDHQLERSRLDYETRESNLVLQHSNEMQALNAAHEQEIRDIQRDAQEKISQAVQNALASQAQALASASAQLAQRQQQEQHVGGTEDAAYVDLLHDYKALEASSATAMKERDVALNQQKALLRELQDLFRAIGTGGIAFNGSNGSAGTVVDGITVEDAVRQIGEQRVRLVALQGDLSRSRREVMQLKRSKQSTPVDGLGSQQTQYLRSVVVQLLCSLNDASVAKRLVPVLSTLLKFSDDDLKAVTKAMPQWTHHR